MIIEPSTTPEPEIFLSNMKEPFAVLMDISLNHDFFAASLSQPRLGHKVVYVESEMAWYYYEPRTRCFQPTTSEKLQTLLRAQFMKCCEAMNLEVSKLTLFDHFRSDTTTRTILQRAKSILAVDDTFFSPTSKNQRRKGPEVNERIARNFAEQLLVRDSSRILTVTQAYVHFSEFLKSQQQAPLHRSQFKSLMAEVIREQFDLGLRHDLKEGEGKQQAGWKGLRVA